MPRALKISIWSLFTIGFIFGFAGLIFPNQSPFVETPSPNIFQFQRLHVFLFNLVGGGATLLYFTEQKHKPSWRVIAYIVASIIFSLLAFFNQYLLAIIMAVVTAVIVELVRVRRYSFFPVEFFKREMPVSRKFHQAALLCLSLGLLIAAFVMLNDQYLKLANLPALILDDFFLGFSFPVSLFTFYVIFSLAKHDEAKHIHVLREISFWVINLGVIIFFVFIIFQNHPMQIASAVLLFSAVILVYVLFNIDRRRIEQARFLDSGILFLVVTSITGIALTLLETYFPVNQPHAWALLLQFHAYLALYGWNLSGLTVIVRYNEFPLHLHDREIILLHWLVVAILAPLGSLYPVFAVLALPGFGILIWQIFFSPKHIGEQRGSI